MMVWARLMRWWDGRRTDSVSSAWRAQYARAETTTGWLHPMLPRWLSPREIAQERRSATRQRSK